MTAYLDVNTALAGHLIKVIAMTAIEDVLSNLKEQRRCWDEFKAAQNTRLSIAEKEIRALFVKTGRSNFSTRGNNQKQLKGHAS